MALGVVGDERQWPSVCVFQSIYKRERAQWAESRLESGENAVQAPRNIERAQQEGRMTERTCIQGTRIFVLQAGERGA